MKQVIVMRTDLNMRKGKMIAQGAHASVYSVLSSNPDLDTLNQWIETGMKKICVGIGSEPELEQVLKKSLDLRVPAFPVYDAGHTEFHGAVTLTCIAVGPWEDEQIDAITGELKLL